MGVWLEGIQNFAADPLGGRIRGDFFRMLRLQLLQTAVQPVIFIVRDHRRIQHIIKIALLCEIFPQESQFILIIPKLRA